MAKNKNINWEELEKESKICLEKYKNFEKSRSNTKSSKKSLEEITEEVNEFCKKHNIPRYNLEIKEKE